MEATSNASTEGSPVSHKQDVDMYSEEDIQKAEEFKDKGNQFFKGKSTIT